MGPGAQVAAGHVHRPGGCGDGGGGRHTLAVPMSCAPTALGRVRDLWGAFRGSQAWLVSIRIAAGAAAPFAGGVTLVPCTTALPAPSDGGSQDSSQARRGGWEVRDPGAALEFSSLLAEVPMSAWWQRRLKSERGLWAGGAQVY